MDKMLLNLRLLQIMRALWVTLIVSVIGIILYFTIPLVYPFIIGWFIAYILNPIVQVLQKRAKFPRWLATITGIIVFLATVTAFITLIVSKIVIEVSRFVAMVNNNIEIWIDGFTTFIRSDTLQNIFYQIGSFYNDNDQYKETIDGNINSIGETLSQGVTSLIGILIKGIITLVTSLPNITFTLVIAILSAFFISKDWFSLKKWIASFFPEKVRVSGSEVWFDLQKALFGYFRAQIIMISITAAVVFVGLMILGVEYALTIALLIGLVDLLPYFGTGAVMIPWFIYLFIQGDVSLGLGIAILYLVTMVGRSIIEPKVLATSIGLNALATLVVMVIGLRLFGVIGILIGPVTLVIVLAVNRADIFRDIRKYIING